MKVEDVAIGLVKPYSKNPRKNEEAIPEVMKSLKEFGFRQPLVVDKDMVLVVGHTRLAAAKRLGLKSVPVHIAVDMTPAQAKAYRLMDNRTSEFASWDKTSLLSEIDELLDLQPSFDMEFMGFSDFGEVEESLKNDVPVNPYSSEPTSAPREPREPSSGEREEVTGKEEQPVTDRFEDQPRQEQVQHFENQYGVIVMCRDEAHQKEIFDQLAGQGLEVKVVVT